MASTNLPITLVANTRPPIFRWRHMVQTMGNGGYSIQECEGTMPPSAEDAVKQLIDDHTRLLGEYAKLKAINDAQKELLNKRAEPLPPVRSHTNATQIQPTPPKKDKGKV